MTTTNESPVRLIEQFSLVSLGISPLSFTFTSCTLSSPSYITIRETLPSGATQLVIVDTLKPRTPLRKPLHGSTLALMHPSKPISALLFPSNLQLFDISKQMRLAATPINERIAFMKWFSHQSSDENNTILALITNLNVYHWNINDRKADPEPIKVFARHDALKPCQIIDYKCDSNAQWMCVVGITAQSSSTSMIMSTAGGGATVRGSAPTPTVNGAASNYGTVSAAAAGAQNTTNRGGVLSTNVVGMQQQSNRGGVGGNSMMARGVVQLYSVEKQVTQILEGHAATFCSFRYESNDVLLFVFAAASTMKTPSQLHIVQLNAPTPTATTAQTSVAPQKSVAPSPTNNNGDNYSTTTGAPAPPSSTAPSSSSSSPIVFGKKSVEIFYPQEARGDFPVGLQTSLKYPSVVYLITKMGYVHVFDIESAQCLYVNRVSDTTLFATCPHPNGGIYGVNRRGQVVNFELNESAVIPFVIAKLKDPQLAIKLASRNHLPGAEQPFSEQFEELFSRKKYRDAAIVAADSPKAFLRTPSTMERFATAQPSNGLMTYLSIVLQRSGKLNKHESIAIAMQMLRTNKAHLLETWVREERLFFCEELGDLLTKGSLTMALAVFIKAKAHEKVVGCLAASGQVHKVWAYAEKVGLKLTKSELVGLAAQVNPQAALTLANTPLSASQQQQQNQIVLAKKKRKSNVDHVAMIDMFMKRGLLQEATSYCLDNLTDDAEDEQEEILQTRILEANLMNNQAVADMILKQDIWHQFNTMKIAVLCERVGLFQHALELYTDVSDIKRVIMNTHVLNPETLITYFAQLAPDDALEVLEELMKNSSRSNLALCVRIAAKYSDQLNALKVIGIFEKLKHPDALYHYLQAIVNYSDEPEVHFKYLDASISLQQYHEVERVTRESNYYDPERVKSMLMRAKLRDPRPLINVCDRFGYIDEMVRYMMKRDQLKFIEGFVTKVNPLRASEVIGTLLDLRVDLKVVQKLMMSVKHHLIIADLCDVVEKFGRLRMLQPVLESRVADGSTDADVHTALAKVYVDIGLNAEHFLVSNAFYDSRIVGAFCVKRDPYLAYVAYSRGKCDAEVIDVTNAHSLFKQQAEYVVNRESNELYSRVLNASNPFRKLVVDQIIGVALPSCTRPEQVTVAVRAFLDAELPELLMELLEKLVMGSTKTAFSRNTNLQNLLLLTAIQAEGKARRSGNVSGREGRVMEYLRRMDNYDALDVGKVCVGAGLYEEAYTVYYKAGKRELALDVLLDNLKDYARAEEFAARIDVPEVWSKLGEALLRGGRVGDGVRALLKAKDARPFLLVIESAREHASDDEYAMVAKYLKVVRSGIRHERQTIDTELAYAFCRCGKLHDLQELLSGRNDADLEEIAERCVDEERWEAAKLLLQLTKNHAVLARVLCELGDFVGALDAATKAKRLEVWQIVAMRAVDAGELRIAHKAALHVVIEPDAMRDMVDAYEDRGYFDELLALMDAALLLDGAHAALFTETGVLYTKYRPDSAREFFQMWWRRCNVPQLVRACEVAALWSEMVYLQRQYGELDNALETMMHHASAWDAADFIDIVASVSSLDVLYRSVQFYAAQHTELIVDLLLVVAPKAESSRVVSVLRSAPIARDESLFGPSLGLLPSCVSYLHKVVSILGDDETPPEVAQALIDVYYAEEALPHLSELVKSLHNFDQLSLAARLQTHKYIAFRQLAIELYLRNGQHERALDLAKQDSLWRDAVKVAADSNDTELCEQLAEWFLQRKMREAFTALLYAAYPFMYPDVGVELAWNSGCLDLAMPFLVQTMSEVGQRLTRLRERSQVKAEKKMEMEKEAEQEVNQDESVLLYGLGTQHQQQNRMLALPGPSGFSHRAGNPGMMRIGWNPSAAGNQYQTYANMYQSRAAAMTQQHNMMMSQAAYRTNALQAAYATRAAQEAYASTAAYSTHK